MKALNYNGKFYNPLMVAGDCDEGEIDILEFPYTFEGKHGEELPGYVAIKYDTFGERELIEAWIVEAGHKFDFFPALDQESEAEILNEYSKSPFAWGQSDVERYEELKAELRKFNIR